MAQELIEKKAEEFSEEELQTLTEEQKSQLEKDGHISVAVEIEQKKDEVKKEEKKEESRSLADLYTQQLREQHLKIQELQARLEQKEEKPDPSLTDPATLFKDPAKLISTIVREAVKPLQDKFTAFEKEKRYGELKSVFKKHPAYAPYFDKLESVLDATIQGYDGPIDVDFMNNALGMLVGKYVTNQLPNIPFETPTTETKVEKEKERERMSTPAHLRPSAPRTGTEVEKKTIQLTELEKRLAKEKGMTDEEYYSLLHMDASQVAVKPKKEEKK